MSVDYSSRKVSVVTVSDFYRALQSDDSMIVGGYVQIGLTDIEGGIFGPTARISVAIQDEGESLEKIELKFLDASHALLRRLVDEPGENLRAVLLENRAEALRLSDIPHDR